MFQFRLQIIALHLLKFKTNKYQIIQLLQKIIVQLAAFLSFGLCNINKHSPPFGRE